MSTPLSDDVIQNVLDKIDAAVGQDQLKSSSAESLRRWLTQPHYAEYAEEIVSLVDAGDFAALDEMFWQKLQFGTGGIRGPMGAMGPATINVRTMAEANHGLAVYLNQQLGKGESGKAVVAHDTRNRSAEFARLSAVTLAANGLQVFLFDSHRSTPELSFAVRHLGCNIGVMISASHNPPSDNGFKAYWSHGGQVLSPHAEGIIDCVEHAAEIPRIDFEEAVASGQIQIVGAEIDQAYRQAVTALQLSTARDLEIVFTPLHGVGETSAYPVLQDAGFTGVKIFEPQRAADGNFPNVPDHLPNPERPEVFDPVIPFARENNAALILACDPDADRLGVCVRDQAGEYVHLTGNRIGTLLADYILRKRSEAGTLTPEHYVVQTLVTTQLITKLALAHNVRAIDQLLVGFKYIGQTMDAEGPEKFVFGAEESLGYLAGQYCRDKDAAVAALYLSECAAELQQSGKTLLDRLDELYTEQGYYLESQLSITCKGASGKEQILQLMQQFFEAPPTELAGIPLVQVRDFDRLEIRRVSDQQRIAEITEPHGQLLMFDSDPESPLAISLAVRPSGTEPKIKFYFFLRGNCDTAANLPDVKEQVEQSMAQAKQECSDWVKKITG